MARPEVTVYGAGIFGLSVAWSCQKRGARVQVIDPHGVGAGASGGIVGALAPHVPENWNPKKEFQRDSLLMAAAFWAEVEQASWLPSSYGRTGRLQPVADAAALALARERAGGAKTLWQGQASWEVVQDPGPFAPASPSGWYIRDTLSARLHPRYATAALAGAFEARGGMIVPQAIARGQVVWATGWHGLEDLSAHFGKQLGQGIKGQAALLRYDAARAPQVFVDGLHLIPHWDGTLAIGSTTEREFATPDQTDEMLEDIVARARAAVPALMDAPVLARWAGLRPRARSRAPVLGAWPGRDGHYVANGGFKIGFGMAPKVGEVMADLLLEGRDAIPPEFLLSALV